MLKLDIVGLPQNICSGISRCQQNLIKEITCKINYVYYDNREYIKSSRLCRYYNLLKTVLFGFPSSGRTDRSKIIHILDQNSAWLLPFFRTRHPLLVTVYDLFMHDNPDRLSMSLFEKLKYKIIFSAIRKTDALTTISNYTKNEIVEKLRYPAEKIKVVYEGVDLEIFKPAKSDKTFLTELGIPKDKKIILNVGTESPRKNLPVLFNAFKIVNNFDKNTILVKIGEPLYKEYRENHKTLIRDIGVESSVFFIDSVTDSDLAKFYSNATVLISPSLREGGFALPILEAMACGCPIVYSDIPPLRETVADSGLCVHPTDTNGFADSILKIINDAQLAKNLSAKSLKRAKLFTWENSAKTLLEFYEDFYNSQS